MLYAMVLKATLRLVPSVSCEMAAAPGSDRKRARVSDDYICLIADVDVTGLLDGKSLKDGTDSVRVAIVRSKIGKTFYYNLVVVSSDAFPDAPSLRFKVEKDGTLRIEVGDEKTMRTFKPLIKADSPDWNTERLDDLFTLLQDSRALVAYEDVTRHKLVGIYTTSKRLPTELELKLKLKLKLKPLWRGSGVFYENTDAEEAYKENARTSGVYLMGRVSLMHFVLLSIAGFGKDTGFSYFELTDAWRGSAVLSKDAILSCVSKSVVSTAEKFREKIDGGEKRIYEIIGVVPSPGGLYDFSMRRFEDELGGDVRITINSAVLMGSEMPPLPFMKPLWMIFLDPSAHDEVFESFEKSLRAFLREELVESYKQRVIAKINESCVILDPDLMPAGTTISEGKVTDVDLSKGIYGIFQNVRSKRSLVSFESPQWAVASSFVDLC